MIKTRSTRNRTRRAAGMLAAMAVVAALVPFGPEPGPAAADPGDVLLTEDFDGVEDGALPEGWQAVEGDWGVVDGELVGTSSGSSQQSRIVFGDGSDLRNYRIEATVRFESAVNNKRWAGVLLDIAADGSAPWSQAVMRSGSTAANGTEFAVRTAGESWNVLTATPAPTEAGTGTDVHMAVEVQGGQARWFWEGEQLARTANLPRTSGNVVGLIANGSTVAFDDVVVTEMEPASLLRDEDQPAYTVAHRGYSTIAPENTAHAFAAAMHAGVRGIELDVQQTADGEHVLWHDSTIDAKSDGTGKISDHTLAELRALDVGSWFDPVFTGTRILTWEEALDQLAGTGVTISLELKGGSVEETLQAVIDRGMQDQVVFTNFSTDLIAQAQAFAPEIRRGLIVSEAADDPMPAVQRYDLSVYVAGANSLIEKPEIVPMLRDAGIAVQAWTVDDANRWTVLNEIGIDGMLTDRAGEYVGFAEALAQGPAAPEASLEVLSPADGASFERTDSLAVGVNATGVPEVTATLDGEALEIGASLDLLELSLGEHVLEVSADGVDPVVRTITLQASPAGLRALIDAADLSQGQQRSLHALVSAQRWTPLAARADQLAGAGTAPEIMAMLADDARSLS